MSCIMQVPQLFEALTESGMRPEVARRVEREVQSSIDQGIKGYRQDERMLWMTQTDGMVMENNLRTELMSKADGIALENNLRTELMSKADGVALENTLRAELMSKADGIALENTLRAELMSKADGVALENTLRAELMSKADGVALENTLRAELMSKADGIALENTLRHEMAVMKSDLCQEMAQLENRLMRYINDHSWKMMGFQVGVMGVMMGLTLTAFKTLH